MLATPVFKSHPPSTAGRISGFAKTVAAACSGFYLGLTLAFLALSYCSNVLAQASDPANNPIESAPASQTLTLKQAVARVLRESGGKILSARRIQTRHGPMFRIKVLTRTGRVRVVQIAESEPSRTLKSEQSRPGVTDK
jgi:hypothetical protein